MGAVVKDLDARLLFVGAELQASEDREQRLIVIMILGLED
jgi:uracil-DNA glycosylase